MGPSAKPQARGGRARACCEARVPSQQHAIHKLDFELDMDMVMLAEPLTQGVWTTNFDATILNLNLMHFAIPTGGTNYFMFSGKRPLGLVDGLGSAAAQLRGPLMTLNGRLMSCTIRPTFGCRLAQVSNLCKGLITRISVLVTQKKICILHFLSS